jgi:hypothetical protein
MMPEDREDARKQYSKTRAEFEKLETQDKTTFVVEATFTTIGQAIEETGRQFADVLERAANFDFDFGSWREEGSEPDAPNPAAPPTAAKRAPSRSKKSSDEDE